MVSRQTGFGVIGSLAAVVLAAGVLHARESTRPLPESAERLMYLRSSATAGRAFLSFDALAADVYWIRAIQHYGRDRKSARTSDRFELLQPLLDVTTTLDPRFSLAYRFGAIFLSMDLPNGPGRPDQAVALLEKGLSNNPTRWQYAHDIGFIHYWYTGDYGAAAGWFAKAAAMPGAPEWIEPLAAMTLAQGGDRQGGRRMLTELLTSEERYIRGAAERALLQLDVLDVIDALQRVVEQFRGVTGRYPAAWGDLVTAGALRGVPVDPTGTPFAYDPDTHTVALSPQSSLTPLPHALGRR